MIIIIEGPDGAGKTTLANKLSEQTGYPILHRTKPKSEEEKQVMMGEYLQIVKTGRNVIFDRCWYSEMVYGPVMRDRSVIDYPQMYALEKRLAKQGALIIYCTDSVAALWMRSQKRGESYVKDKETFNEICKRYDELFDVPHYVPVVTYRCPEL